MNKLLKYSSCVFTLAVFFVLANMASAKEAVPAPTIISPENEATVNFPVVTITGEATPGNLIKIKVNGKNNRVNNEGEKTVTVDEDGNFSAQVLVQGKNGKMIKVKAYSVNTETKSVSAPAIIYLTLGTDLLNKKYTLQLSCGIDDDDYETCQNNLANNYSALKLVMIDSENDFYGDWAKTININDEFEVKGKLYKNVQYKVLTLSDGGSGATATITPGDDKEISVSLYID